MLHALCHIGLGRMDADPSVSFFLAICADMLPERMLPFAAQVVSVLFLFFFLIIFPEPG